MWSAIKGIFSGGLVGSLEKVALEYIDTAKESAEAAALMIKTMDPNGKMRRDLARFASFAYGFYLINAVIMIYLYALGWGDSESIAEAVTAMTELFLPITGAWTTIVSASFGVNYANVKAGK